MLQTQEQITPSELIKLSPAEVQAWLNRVWSGKEEVPEDFHWHGLAEGAASRANPFKGTPNLGWAVISAEVYKKLAYEIDPGSEESYLPSAMNLRASLIQKLGVVKEHPVLDPETIVRWFYDNLHISYEAAVERSAKWKESGPRSGLSMADVLELNRIKHRLSYIKRLVESGHLDPDEEIAKWLEIRDQLP